MEPFRLLLYRVMSGTLLVNMGWNCLGSFYLQQIRPWGWVHIKAAKTKGRRRKGHEETRVSTSYRISFTILQSNVFEDSLTVLISSDLAFIHFLTCTPTLACVQDPTLLQLLQTNKTHARWMSPHSPCLLSQPQRFPHKLLVVKDVKCINAQKHQQRNQWQWM